MKTTAHLDYERILANQPTPIYFALQFEAHSVAHGRAKPGAFCVVLDRSGSMQGTPLERAKEAAQTALKNLRPDDLISVVVFDDTANTAVPLQPAKDKQALHKAIGEIVAGGSTNLTGGWMLGRDELRKAPEGVIRRAMLLSDGHLNVGIVEPAQVRQIVSSGLEQEQVRTSCLGFGDHYNEDLMSDLATATGGQFYDAVSAEKFPAIFTSELESLQRIVVQNLRVRIKRLDFCDGFLCLGEYPNVALPDGRREFSLGDLVSDEERIVVFALSVLPLPNVGGLPVVSLQGEPLLEFELNYDELTADGIRSKSELQTIRIQQVQDPAEVKINAKAIPWVSLQRAAQTMKTATEHMDAGREAEAVSALNDAIAALKRYGPKAEVNEAVNLLESMVQKVAAGAWNLRLRKSSHYYHKSLRRMSSKEMWSGDEAAPSFKKQPEPEPGSTPPKPPEPPMQA
jgi:Ca-activated chloride channel family protein